MLCSPTIVHARQKYTVAKKRANTLRAPNGVTKALLGRPIARFMGPYEAWDMVRLPKIAAEIAPDQTSIDGMTLLLALRTGGVDSDQFGFQTPKVDAIKPPPLAEMAPMRI